MSIDKFHFVKGNTTTTDLKDAEEVASFRRAHSIFVMWSGVEHLFFFEDGAQAASTFEIWRREPCERIALTLSGVPQAGGRLPLGTQPGDGCDIDVSWDGEFDTDGDPNGPARWKVRCGQPVSGEMRGRPFCQEHLVMSRRDREIA